MFSPLILSTTLLLKPCEVATITVPILQIKSEAKGKETT